MYSAEQYSTVQYSAEQYITVRHCTYVISYIIAYANLFCMLCCSVVWDGKRVVCCMVCQDAATRQSQACPELLDTRQRRHLLRVQILDCCDKKEVASQTDQSSEIYN